LWNTILDDTGYIAKYRKNQIEFHKHGFKLKEELIDKWSKEKQLNAYKKGMKENWTNPNSTDIHSLNKVNNIYSYVTKYCTKSDSKQPIEGKLWGRSDNFETMNNYKEIIDVDTDNYIFNVQLNQAERFVALEKCSIIKRVTFAELEGISPYIAKELKKQLYYNFKVINGLIKEPEQIPVKEPEKEPVKEPEQVPIKENQGIFTF
jgi:hypothetical protein